MASPHGSRPFWKTTKLEDMTPQQWDSLCDGCARCCLAKLECEDTGDIAYTAVGCRLLDAETCRCTDYGNRSERVPDCVRLTPEAVRTLDWLPPTCAYRLLAQGRDLYWWHPLVSGDSETVHAAGISVRDRVAANEEDVPVSQLEDFIVDWPLRWPRGARGQAPTKPATQQRRDRR